MCLCVWGMLVLVTRSRRCCMEDDFWRGTKQRPYRPAYTRDRVGHSALHNTVYCPARNKKRSKAIDETWTKDHWTLCCNDGNFVDANSSIFVTTEQEEGLMTQHFIDFQDLSFPILFLLLLFSHFISSSSSQSVSSSSSSSSSVSSIQLSSPLQPAIRFSS